jgi:RNA polymerase sigma-70 factor (ECF subfamily)
MPDAFPGRADFPSTHWSVLQPGQAAFLERLAQRYWRPAFCYVRGVSRLGDDAAMDLTQEFFARMLEKGYLERVDPGAGSFRGYLKTALKNFCLNARRSERTRRAVFTPGTVEEPPAEGATPEESFDREWARGLVRESLEELRKALEREGKPEYFALLSDYYHQEGADVASIAKKFRMAPHDVTNRLRTARGMLRAIVKERVLEYLGPGDDAEQELIFLLGR